MLRLIVMLAERDHGAAGGMGTAPERGWPDDAQWEVFRRFP